MTVIVKVLLPTISLFSVGPKLSITSVAASSKLNVKAGVVYIDECGIEESTVSMSIKPYTVLSILYLRGVQLSEEVPSFMLETNLGKVIVP